MGAFAFTAAVARFSVRREPAGRFKQQAAQKASCVDCAFPSTNFGGGEVCDACVSGYVNTVDNGTAVCRECPRGFLCHEGSTRRNVTLRRGFWRSKYELEATKCRTRNCDGGIGKGDALCRDGSTGPACDVCIKGRAPSRKGTCKVCDDVKREREVLKDLMKHQKRTLGRRLSSLGSRLGLKVPEEDVDVEGPASPLAAGRA